jgi:adenylate cyclase
VLPRGRFSATAHRRARALVSSRALSYTRGLTGEQGGAGVLIADARGYTSFTQERGDDEAGRLAARFAACTRECVDAAGGRVLELRGDEALCVFDSPRQALRTAIALQRVYADATREDLSLPLLVGIGLDAGEAVAVEGGYRGAALNLASRLCSLAGPGEVLASEGVLLMAGRVEGVTYTDRGRVRVKGVRDPVRVRRLQFDLDLPAVRPSAPPSARWRSPRVLAAAGAVILLASVAPAAVLATRGSGGLKGVAGDSAALLDTSGKILGQFPVGRTPVAVVSDGSTAWTLDADAQTISRVDRDGGRPLTKGPGLSPTSLALGGGLLWVAYVQEHGGGKRAGIAALDPSTLAPRGQTLLPVTGPNSGEVPHVVYADGAVWVSGPFDLLRRVDPQSFRVTHTIRLEDDAVGLAAGLGSVWATSGRGIVTRVEVKKARIVRRIPVATPSLAGIAIGAGSVWAADPLAGQVWRIDPGPQLQMHTVRVGLGASGLAFGRGALWAAGAVDGRVVRIDPESEAIVTGAVITEPARQLPPAGREFVRELSATQQARAVNFFAPFAAQAAEVLLAAIAHSDGTRTSVTRQLLRVRIPHGILGPVEFDKSGDISQNLVSVFRVRRAPPGVFFPEDPVFAVLSAPVRLVR